MNRENLKRNIKKNLRPIGFVDTPMRDEVSKIQSSNVSRIEKLKLTLDLYDKMAKKIYKDIDDYNEHLISSK